jgi:hypothetical protein
MWNAAKANRWPPSNTMTKSNRAAFSPHGLRIVTTGGDRARVWQLITRSDIEKELVR